jgi:hypothetical protein
MLEEHRGQKQGTRAHAKHTNSGFEAPCRMMRLPRINYRNSAYSAICTNVHF